MCKSVGCGTACSEAEGGQAADSKTTVGGEAAGGTEESVLATDQDAVGGQAAGSEAADGEAAGGDLFKVLMLVCTLINDFKF